MQRISLVLLLAILVVNLFSQSSPHSVTLTWTAPTGGGQVTGYNVKRGTSSGNEAIIGSTTTALTYVDPFQISDEGKKFFYVVTATGPGGESLPSGEVFATIPFSLPTSPTGLSAQVR